MLRAEIKGVERIICVNFANDGGFALISAQKSHMPILAYSNDGHFNVEKDDVPFPLNLWLDETMNEIAESEVITTDSLATISNIWRRYGSNVPKPMVDDYPPQGGNLVNMTWDEYMVFSRIMMDKINEWNSQGYRVSAINDYAGMTSLGDKNAMGDYVQGHINPLYLDDYWAITLVVEKDIDNSYTQDRKIKTKWTQENGYNQSLDLYWNEYEQVFKHIPVGCGPLSLGQIMHANRHPSTFDWDAMTISGPGNKTTADFLKDVHIQCKTVFCGYPSYGSGSTFDDRIAALEHYGYSYDIINADSFNHNTIMEKSPLMVSSFFNNDIYNMGHAWVIDGATHIEYKSETEIWTFNASNDFVCVFSETSKSINQNKYYAVWGFDDNSDGYYDLSKMLPSSQSFFANTFKVAAGNIKPIK